MNQTDEELYQCVGICMADPDSGYCLGCGRPPPASPDIVAEAVANSTQAANDTANPDSPE